MTAIAAARSMMIVLLGFLLGLVLAMIALPAVANAQVAGPAEPAPSKTRSVVVYGDDPCPASSGDEIVVCARQPESERYRIPKRFRGQKAAASPAGNSWTNKAVATEGNARAAAGLPNTCSAVGSGGQSGCFMQFMQQQAAIKRQTKDADPDQP
ncbi:hypothetical protein [Sphingomonas morindae]|uniref:DUF4189 domain-containing protein n=1 Tax=Sphingomonas morindae TaxID=1541170 RepID=A0ABY4X582_9SPHN|nr:hypothetical protein [Sphingomonas morindae]USI72051.1 hypothetical protein LHA26_12130 [Sphingomonas morindae]